MNCYHCGCRLSEKDFCTGCGVDVSLYKRIMKASNMFYNEGLEKANVRDLSGAITSLRQSLKFNKNNIKARNLLGLVYYEMGEAVAALSEWVISKNIKSTKNVADDYINDIQSNPTRLETYNQTIKKYNQALAYCHQDSLDLAVIQLKKVLSMNANFVRAHQLLALIYIHTEEWEKARKELTKCCKIDTNNTTTLRYLKEINLMAPVEEDNSVQNKIKKTFTNETIKYKSGNDTIIQPMNQKELNGGATIINIIIGAVIGLAIAWFLVLPARVQNAKATVNNELIAVSEQADATRSKSEELQQQVTTLTEENTTLQTQIDSYEGTSGTIQASDNLLKAASLYITNPSDLIAVSEYLGGMDPEFIKSGASADFLALYQNLLGLVGPGVSKQYYTSGYSAYKQSDFTTAITDLTKAVTFDSTNGEALFNLANAYNKNGDVEKAITTYNQVVELFPDTEKANRSKDYIAELKK